MSKIIKAQYAVGRTLPQEKPPRGRVLAHNDIEHTVRMPNGGRGFRWWTWPKDELPPDFGRCKCGWAGLPHYARPPSGGRDNIPVGRSKPVVARAKAPFRVALCKRPYSHSP